MGFINLEIAELKKRHVELSLDSRCVLNREFKFKRLFWDGFYAVRNKDGSTNWLGEKYPRLDKTLRVNIVDMPKYLEAEV